MPKDNAEVTVKSTVQNPAVARKYSGMSGLEAGLLYGGAAATVMGGPIGLLVGLGTGIVAHRMKKSYLDNQAAYLQNVRAEHEEFSGDLSQEQKIADPDEARMLQHAKRMEADGWMRLESGDGTGREMVENANAIMRGIVQGDITARKQQEAEAAGFQRNLIGTSANTYRDQYQQMLSTFEDMEKQTTQVLDLVASKGFDPNKPFNKAVLTDMISVGVNGLYKDDPNALESLARKVPIIGDAMGDLIKSDDYKLTAEDYNRVALEMKSASQRFTQDRMTRLGDQAKSLDAFARRIGAIAPDYSLGDYVSGGVKELKLTPVPKYTAPKQIGNGGQVPWEDAPNDQVRTPDGKIARFPKLERWKQEWLKKHGGPNLRPTN